MQLPEPFLDKVKNVAVFMGFDEGEQDRSDQETMNQWEPTTGSKNRTFRRVFAKPEHSLLHVETDSREEVLQSILFANRFLRKKDQGGGGQLFDSGGITNKAIVRHWALLFNVMLYYHFG